MDILEHGDGKGVKRTETFDTVVIGGGQAGLSTGYHLKRAGRNFVILDDRARTGDVWRQRWDSLRQFTPAKYSSLEGMPFPSAPWHFATKDEFADYLEAYAAHFGLPVRHRTRVQHLGREVGEFIISTSNGEFRARHVVVAMSNYQRPQIPRFAAELDPGIVQVHSSEYRSPAQVPADGPTLVVGAGNSGAEIALELSRTRRVVLAGRYPGHLPFEVHGRAAQAFLARFVLKGLFHRVLTVRTPMGRKLRPYAVAHSGPLIRTKARHLAAAGVERVERIEGAKDGKPVLPDGTALDVRGIVWCTGYRTGFEWIDLPLQFDGKSPVQRRGVVESVPGLYFVGLHFQYALSSAMIHGVGRDARYVVQQIAARTRAAAPSPTRPDGAPAARAA